MAELAEFAITDLHYNVVTEFVVANCHVNAVAWLSLAASSQSDTPGTADIFSDFARTFMRRLPRSPATERISYTLQNMMHHTLDQAKLSVVSAGCGAVSSSSQQSRELEEYSLSEIDIILCSILLVWRCQLLLDEKCNILGFSQSDFTLALARIMYRLETASKCFKTAQSLHSLVASPAI